MVRTLSPGDEMLAALSDLDLAETDAVITASGSVKEIISLLLGRRMNPGARLVPSQDMVTTLIVARGLYPRRTT